MCKFDASPLAALLLPAVGVREWSQWSSYRRREWPLPPRPAQRSVDRGVSPRRPSRSGCSLHRSLSADVRRSPRPGRSHCATARPLRNGRRDDTTFTCKIVPVLCIKKAHVAASQFLYIIYIIYFHLTMVMSVKNFQLVFYNCYWSDL